jgi:hypothetical protein
MRKLWPPPSASPDKIGLETLFDTLRHTEKITSQRLPGKSLHL